MPAPSLAAPSTPEPSQSPVAQSSGTTPDDGSGTSFLLLSLREEDGACIATALAAGFAHVIHFAWTAAGDDLEVVCGGDEWPPGADDHWSETRDIVAAFLNGTAREQQAINAALAGAYLAYREAA